MAIRQGTPDLSDPEAQRPQEDVRGSVRSVRKVQPNLWTDCPECARYFEQHPLIVAACASVGIEHNKSTRQMMVEYFIELHARDHFTDIPRVE